MGLLLREGTWGEDAAFTPTEGQKVKNLIDFWSLSLIGSIPILISTADKEMLVGIVILFLPFVIGWEEVSVNPTGHEQERVSSRKERTNSRVGNESGVGSRPLFLVEFLEQLFPRCLTAGSEEEICFISLWSGLFVLSSAVPFPVIFNCRRMSLPLNRH